MGCRLRYEMVVAQCLALPQFVDSVRRAGAALGPQQARRRRSPLQMCYTACVVDRDRMMHLWFPVDARLMHFVLMVSN